MLELLVVIVRALALACRGHRELVFENLALRQQLTALRRTTKRAHLQTRDRLFWIALARSWRNWRMALVLVQPDTIVRWHRDWLRRRWTRLSKRRPDGRPPIDQQIRALVRDMASANPLWGVAADSRGTAHARRPRLRAHGLASAGTAHAPAVADVEDVSHESPRVSRVDGFLHRPDTHRSRAVRVDRAVASSAAHRAFQHHGASDGHVDGPTSRRRIPGRHRTQMVASRSRQRLQRDFPASSGGHGHRRSGLSPGESLAESVRGTR